MGVWFQKGFDAQRLRDHFQQSPQDILTPAVQEMLSQVKVQHTRQALEELEAAHRAQIDGLARANESLSTSNNRLKGELTRLGGRLSVCSSFLHPKSLGWTWCPNFSAAAQTWTGGSRGCKKVWAIFRQVWGTPPAKPPKNVQT